MKQTQRTACGRDEISSCSGVASIAQARGWKTLLHHPAQARELGPSLFESDSASQPRDDGQRVVLLVRIPGEGVGEPGIQFAGNGISEAFWRNPDDLVRLAAQANRGTDGSRNRR